ncbi:hypothetical protein WG66_006594 [Moniliophthora roreri]|nr:hypothetical protein WG66_006594 [Moniliophthora roreri]
MREGASKVLRRSNRALVTTMERAEWSGYRDAEDDAAEFYRVVRYIIEPKIPALFELISKGKNKGGRPAKKKHGGRNISGLRNQKRPFSPVSTDDEGCIKKARVDSENVDSDLEDISAEKDLIELAERHSDLDEMDWLGESGPDLVAEDKEAEDVDAEEFWEDEDWEERLADEELMQQLSKLTKELGDDPENEDWVPVQVQTENQRRKKQLKGEYKKGPDVASKSMRTQCCYRREIRKQTYLDYYFDPVLLSSSSNAIDIEGNSEKSVVDVDELSEASSSAVSESEVASDNRDIECSSEELESESEIDMDTLRDDGDEEEWEFEAKGVARP